MEREGRPRRTTAEEDQWIIAAVGCDPSMTAAEIREELGLQVSLSTIRKHLHAAGLRSRVACQRPLLTQSHKRLRLEFPTNHLAWTVQDWKLVVFFDESTFCSKYEPQYAQQVATSGGRSVSVWGAIMHQGRGPLHRLEGTLTAEAYADIQHNVLLPFILEGPFPDGCFVFQQDRSPIHTSRRVRELLEELCIQELPWPPKGADFNVIENIRGLMKRRLARRQLHGASPDLLWDSRRMEQAPGPS
ncbi:hypothetical protein HPB47_014088 [Ixodes persulcatus]|uniref:Uncharacterized protein n=1 Tax=Ixodes persulcatus TaxID=34615 RepID=A0AC60QX58_IXOPE|nr:hypothetical protein HPB47_014088 [Ixodes persulcatus]